ncbi:hypothetical protein N9F40_01440 [bacterium]|nr:hypothetical protein [bacterium]
MLINPISAEAINADETLLALGKNVRNDLFSEVHILLEDATAMLNCLVFCARLRLGPNLLSKIHCNDNFGVQSHFMVYQYCKQKRLSNRILVLAPVHDVFDDSLRFVKTIEESTVLVISSKRDYDSLNDLNVKTTTSSPSEYVPSHCAEELRYNWDTVVFRPNLVHLNSFLFRDVVTQKFFHMNESFAESAALYAVYLASPKLLYVFQVCDFVHVFRIRAQPKEARRVRHWGIIPSTCSAPDKCVPSDPILYECIFCFSYAISMEKIKEAMIEQYNLRRVEKAIFNGDQGSGYTFSL